MLQDHPVCLVSGFVEMDGERINDFLWHKHDVMQFALQAPDVTLPIARIAAHIPIVPMLHTSETVDQVSLPSRPRLLEASSPSTTCNALLSLSHSLP